MKLSQLDKNSTGTIKEVLESNVLHKLLEFGILPGASFVLVEKAPFSGPIYIQVDTTLLALRISEAENVLVE